MTPRQISIRKETCLEDLNKHEERYEKSHQHPKTESTRENSDTTTQPASHLVYHFGQLDAWLCWLFDAASSLGWKKLTIGLGILVVSMSVSSPWFILGLLYGVVWLLWKIVSFVLIILLSPVAWIFAWLFKTITAIAVFSFVCYFFVLKKHPRLDFFPRIFGRISLLFV